MPRFLFPALLLLLVSCGKDPATDIPLPQPNAAEIVSFSPTTVTSGDILTITLKNFTQVYTTDTSNSRKDIILIGTVPAVVKSASLNSLTVYINPQHKTNKIVVVIGKDTAISKESININFSKGTWQKVSVCPGGDRFAFATFNFADSAYFGFGQAFRNGYVTGLLDFWKFNLKDTGWVKLSDAVVAGPAYSETVSFQTDGKGYINFQSLSSKQTWSYTPATRLWTQNSNGYSGSFLQQAVCSGSTVAYIGANKNPGNNTKSGFFQYDALTNSFNYFADIADTANSPIINSFMLGDNIYFGIKQEIIGSYYYGTARFYQFNTSSKTFTRKKDFPEMFASWNSSFGFVYKGSGYIINSNKLYRYDVATDTWEQKRDFDGYTGNTLDYYGSFEYNGSAYLFVYSQSWQHAELWKYTD
jgi:hypothetical protein